jgi:UDP-N-acetylmuramate dehydrogenase
VTALREREEALVAVEGAAPGRCRRDVPLGRFTTYKTGGPAELLAEPETEAELAALLAAAHEAGLPVFVVGAGSNLLVREGGLRGLVIRLGTGFGRVTVEGRTLVAGAMAPMSRVAVAAERASLAGLEFGFDIPGTVGGALAMNAGAHGGEIRDVLVRVRGVDPTGSSVVVASSEIRFGYRTAVYPAPLVFTEGTFALAAGDRGRLEAIREQNHAFRLRTQPKGRTVGSVFRNPPGDHAGRLIEAAGLKGARIGGAVVSEKHANWIVGERRVTAGDVEGLVRLVQSRVRERFGVDLETELRIVGDPGEGERSP